MKKIIFILPSFFFLSLSAQNVGIGTSTPNASAKLDISDTTKGLLIPRMTDVQRNLIMSPAKGLMVFVTTDSSFYYFDGAWLRIAPAAESWSRKGNVSTNPLTQFVGTTDNKPLYFKVNNLVGRVQNWVFQQWAITFSSTAMWQ